MTRFTLNNPSGMRLCALAGCLVLIACGDDDMMSVDGGAMPDGGMMLDGAIPDGALTDGSVGPDAGAFFDTVEERLGHLGIPLPDLDSPEVGGTAMRDLEGDDLPAGSHPLRTTIATLDGASELYLTGTGRIGGGAIVDFDRPGIAGENTHVVGLPGGGLEVFAQPTPVALHLDDDGRQEMLVFDVRGGQLFVFGVEDEEAGFATGAAEGEVVGEWPGATKLRAIARDEDGDGIDEVFLAAVMGPNVGYRSYDPATKTLGELEFYETPRLSLPSGALIFPTPSALSIAAGNSDLVPGEEAAVVISFDEHFTQVLVVGQFDRWLERSDLRPLTAAGVAMADVDGDYLDELVIGGTPNSNPAAGSYEISVSVYDDGAHGYSPVYEDSFVGSVTNGSGTVRMRETHLHVARTSIASVDLPGATPPSDFNAFDPADDVLINNVLFEFRPVALPEGATPTERIEAMAVEPDEIFAFGSETELIVDMDSVQFALGQLDGDGLPDAAVLTATPGIFEDTRNAPHTLYMKSLLAGPERRTVLRPDGRAAMRMVQANVDSDSIVVRHLEEEHQMRYSEPLILAVLAAAPCYAGPVGQFTNECSTTFGNTVSSSAGSESTFGFSIGVTTGFGWEDRTASQSELKATATLTANTSFSTGSSTEISLTRSYSNGAPEDQILATVFGLEQFTYQILSAPPGPNGEDRVGQTITVSIPRSEVQTTRLFSESLIRPSLRPSQAAALDRVLSHTPTDPSTYPRRSELRAHMTELGITGPECTESTSPDQIGDCGYLTSRDGIDPGTVSLPGGVSGSGTNGVGQFEVTNSTTSSNGWGFESSMDLDLSVGGAIFGLSIGASAESNVTVGHSSSVQYGFSAGAVDPAVYAPYQAQLVAFHHRFDCNDSGACQGFEVVSFWAEPTTP